MCIRDSVKLVIRVNVPFHTIAQASLLTTTKVRANGRRDALVPAALREGMHSRLHACFRLFRVKKRAQLLLVGLRQVLAHDGYEDHHLLTARRRYAGSPSMTRDSSH